MILRFTAPVNVDEIFRAEELAAKMLDGTTDCPHCRFTGTLHKLTRGDSPYKRRYLASLVGDDTFYKHALDRLPDVYCDHCGRTSTPLEVYARAHALSLTEAVQTLCKITPRPEDHANDESTDFTSADAILRAVEILHEELAEELAEAEQGRDTPPALLRDLRLLERRTSTLNPYRAAEIWKQRGRAAAVLPPSRGGVRK